MKKPAGLAAFLALCLLLAGCEREVPPEPSPSQSADPSASAQPQTLAEFTLPYDPQGTWDPYAGSGNANMTLRGLVYEGLYELDESFAPAPVLAQRAQESEDGFTWTITLRTGVTFSDGTALTPQTSQTAILRAMSAESAYAARLSGVESVRADEEGNALIFTLKAPNKGFLALLDVPLAHSGPDGVYGTGPYAFRAGAMEARQGWWRGEKLPQERLGLTAVTGADDLLLAFDGGRLSFAAADLTGPNALGYGGTHQTWDYPTSTMLFLGYRTAGGFCADEGLRQSLSLAYDRAKLVTEVLAGHASVAAYPAPPTSARYNSRVAAGLSHDKDKAADKLEELGYTLGEDGLRYKGRNPVSLTLLVNSENSFQVRAAHSVKADLEALGLQMTVKAAGWEEYLKSLNEGKFDLYLGECRLTGDMDLTPFFTRGSGLCYGGEDYALLEAARTARSTGDFEEFDELWAQKAPFGVLCFKSCSVMTAWGRCQGLNPTQGNLFYGIENWEIVQ